MLQRLRALSLLITTVFVISFGITSPAQAAVKSAPSKVKVTSTTNSVQLSWAAVKGATHYTVCLKKELKDAACFLSSPELTTTQWQATELKPTKSADYFATITAHDTTSAKGTKPIKVSLKPEAPTSVAVSTTQSSVKVAWASAENATGYKVCFKTASKSKKCWKTSGTLKGNSYTLSKLKPTVGGDYFIEVIAYRGNATNPSAKARADLQVGAAKTPQVAATTFEGAKVNWSKTTNANNYAVVLSRNPNMTDPVARGKTGSASFEALGLKAETTYYAQVTPFNSDIPGKPSAPIAFKTEEAPPPINVSVMTYNLCGGDQCFNRSNAPVFNAQVKSGKPAVELPWFPTWLTRAPLLSAFLGEIDVDIMAFQEDKAKLKVPGYTTAHYKSSKSLVFKTSKFTKLRSGHITMPSGGSGMVAKYAVWAELKDMETGLRFIVVDPHLQYAKGKRYDDARKKQSLVLLSELGKINPNDLPLVIAGDLNSNASNANQKNYPGGYDAPKKIFEDAGLQNTVIVAKSKIGAHYNTANQGYKDYKPSIYKGGYHVDAIWVTPGISVDGWEQYMRLDPTGLAYAEPFLSDHNPIAAKLLLEHKPTDNSPNIR